jgi:hypothetical protein
VFRGNLPIIGLRGRIQVRHYFPEL